MKPWLVLASTSPYRRQLLDRLGLAYQTARPEVDEARRPDEPPATMASRLAEAKARAVAVDFPAALVIGADQVAVLEDPTTGQTHILGKPGNHAGAVAQLRQVSGQTVHFLTALCLYHSASGRCHGTMVPYHVTFRLLNDALIEGYLRRERPYDCADSFKSEGLGIVLFERMAGEDPTALIGLPLIALRRLLQQENVAIL
ncbi:MAG: septum formation inhibitor Maf [Magnetococcales bacterium]|nr:septum formation inhibitor Maf [Magnetococcales bacterium]